MFDKKVTQKFIYLCNSIFVKILLIYTRLFSCALYYGSQLESGHYSAVVFKAKGDKVYEISDINTKNISFSWKDAVASHVYLAFYSLVEKKNRNRNEIDDSKSPCCPKRDRSDCIQVSDDDSLE